MLALLLSLIFVATFHLARLLFTIPSETMRCLRYRLSDAASCVVSPPFRTHVATRARGCPRPTPTRGRCFAAWQEPSCLASHAALVVPRHLSGLGFATPPGILQPDLGFEVHSVSFRRFPDRRDITIAGIIRTSLGIQRGSSLRSAPFEDLLLVDSCCASRRCLPPCRSPF